MFAASIARAWSIVMLAIALCWPAAAFGQAALETSEATDGAVILVDIEGPIGPAAAQHVASALDDAREAGARAVVLRIDTPGGLDTAMRDIIREILASEVPVVGWVAPSGARAASAGTYILFATHIAAMAPATTLGAATPVRIGGPAFPGGAEPEGSPDGDAMERKIVNDARAYLRGLARLRGRNLEWADRAVLKGESSTSREALEQDVIDLIAEDSAALLEQLDGRRVEVVGGALVLHTAGAPISVHEPSWRMRLLSILVDPNIAYLLLILGFYGLFFELASPGYVLPGVVGAICLVLALFAFSTLPVNWAGLALIVLGVGFMIAEVFAPSFGALGIGGVVAFAAGSLILVESGSELFQISLGLVLGVCIVSALFFIGVIGLALRSRRARVVSGREELAGAPAVAVEDFVESGRVRAHGELWRARSSAPVQAGQKLRVRGVENLTLLVEPLGHEVVQEEQRT